MGVTNSKLRLDKYLWAIRVFKTRTQATAACDEGKVKINGQSVKPSRNVVVNDRYDIRTPARKWTIEVTGLLQNRVGYEEASVYYVDLTSEEDLLQNRQISTSFYTGKRLSKTGRPSKKQRRDLNGFMDDDEPSGSENQ